MSSPFCTIPNSFTATYSTPKSTYFCPAGSFCVDKSAINSEISYNDYALLSYLDLGLSTTPFANCTSIQGDTAYQCPCLMGQFCLENSTSPQFCPPGMYCSTPAALPVANTDGQFSQLSGGWYFQKKCDNKNGCSGACSVHNDNTAFLVVLIALVALSLFIWNFHLFRRMKSVFERKNTGQEKGEKRFLLTRRKSFALKRATLSVQDSKSTSVAQSAAAATPYNIAFTNISRTLKTGEKILDNVSGVFEAGKMTAVMGPSGAGKSTLLTAIVEGLYDEGGAVTVNDTTEPSLRRYSRITGVVPQEDVMIRNLTVRQNISFQADYRLPASMNKVERAAQVDKVIKSLGLEHVQDQLIGDELTRGISGGQRKRVNVAMEMVTMPSILLMDEPTSGLDSTSSLALCDAVEELSAAEKMTTIAVVHQPSPEAFDCFHSVIVLSRGGKAIYCGPRSELREYLASLGYTCDDSKNVADFAMEVASGMAERNVSPQLTPVDLFNLWQKKNGAEGIADDAAPAPADDDDDDDAGDDTLSPPSPKCGSLTLRVKAFANAIVDFVGNLGSNFCTYWGRLFRLVGRELKIYNCCEKDEFRTTPGFTRQIWICFRRSLMWYTDFGAVMSDIAIHVFMGLLIAPVASDFGFVGRWQESYCVTQPVSFLNICAAAAPGFAKNYIIGAQFILFAVVFAAMTSSACSFGVETANYLREYTRGLSTTAYFFGKFLSETPRIVIDCSFFYAAMTLHFGNVSTMSIVFNTVLVCYLWSWPLGYLVEGFVGVRMSPILSVIVALVFVVLFSGMGQYTVPSRPAAIKVIFNLFGSRWTSAALVGGQVKQYEFTDSGEQWMLIDTTIANYGWEASVSTCNWYAFACGMVTLFVACFFRIISRQEAKLK